MDFKLGEDVLRFDDLFGSTKDQVSALLKGASLTLDAHVDNKLLLTLGEDYGNPQIEITLTDGLKSSVVNTLNAGDQAAQAALLQQLLSNS